MRFVIKRILWCAVALLVAGLILVAAWLASNWRDADPQPWPEALTPLASPVAETNNFWIALVEVPAVGGGAPRLTLGDCSNTDCGAAWRDGASQWAAMRQAHAALGTACEAGTQRASPQLVEPLPATFKPDAELPRFQPITDCSAWLLTLALEASAVGDIDAATAKLAQSARLGVAALEGSQSLIGHIISLAVWNRHLHAIQQIAAQHPASTVALQALPLPTAAQMGAAQRRWVAFEASYTRAMVGSMANGEMCSAAFGPSDWFCRINKGTILPNYTEQLVRQQWLQVQESIRDDAPLSAFNAYQVRLAEPSKGLFGSQWYWRGTISHILFDAARPTYQDYFARSANTLLAAQSTQLWLKAQSQAPVARASWMSQQTKDTPLSGRLSVQPEGDWQLQALDAAGAVRAPVRWPAWPI